MKASNIFQKLKAAGVGNPDGVPSKKPIIKAVGIKSPTKMAKKSPMEMGKKSPMEMGKKSPFKAFPDNMPKNENKKKKKKDDPYAKALANNPDLPNLIKKRKGLDKNSNEYKKIQNAINKAYGVSKRYELTEEPAETNTPAETETPAETTPKDTKVDTANKNIDAAKDNIKNVRTEVAQTNKEARQARRAEKKAARKQRRADRINKRAERIKKEGGTRVGNFLRSVVGKKPAAAQEDSPAEMKKSAMKMGKKSPTKMAKKAPTKFNAKLKKAAAEGKIKGKFKEVVEKAPMKLKKKPSVGKKVKTGNSEVSQKRADRLIKRGKASMSYKVGGVGKDNQPGGKNNKGQLMINRRKSVKIKKIKK